TAANGTTTTSQCRGTLTIMHQDRQLVLKNVLYHPSFYNLISGQHLGDHTTACIRKTMEVRVGPTNDLLYKIERDSKGTMWIRPDNIKKKVIKLKVNKLTLQDLHERYGHIFFDVLKKLLEAKD